MCNSSCLFATTCGGVTEVWDIVGSKHPSMSSCERERVLLFFLCLQGDFSNFNKQFRWLKMWCHMQHYSATSMVPRASNQEGNKGVGARCNNKEVEQTRSNKPPVEFMNRTAVDPEAPIKFKWSLVSEAGFHSSWKCRAPVLRWSLILVKYESQIPKYNLVLLCSNNWTSNSE